MARLYIQTIKYPSNQAYGFSLIFWMRKIGTDSKQIQITDLSKILEYEKKEFYPLLKSLSEIPGIKKLVLEDEAMDLYFETIGTSLKGYEPAKEILRKYLKGKESQ